MTYARGLFSNKPTDNIASFTDRQGDSYLSTKHATENVNPYAGCDNVIDGVAMLKDVGEEMNDLNRLNQEFKALNRKIKYEKAYCGFHNTCVVVEGDELPE